MRRVVVTGMGLLTPVGNEPDEVFTALCSGQSGVTEVPGWNEVPGLGTRLGGLVCGVDTRTVPRKQRRTMGRMAVLGSIAADAAVADAGLTPELLSSGRAGVAMGSTTGSPAELERFFAAYLQSGLEQQEGTLFMRVMSHTLASNVAGRLGTFGRLLAPCAACASSTQAIGAGYEAIAWGLQDVMVCGGAEEMHAMSAGVFDILSAASRAEPTPPVRTPRPFDRDRDGLVVGEGAGVVVLEAYEHARHRGASILGEVLGYATCCGAGHMTSSNHAAMVACMRAALAQAELNAEGIDYVNAHATGTVQGDAAEAAATRAVFPQGVRVSSLKGHMGHTLGACGAIEVIACLCMMHRNCLAPTLNLEQVGEDCAGADYLREPIETRVDKVISNNFAFGDINATLILGRT